MCASAVTANGYPTPRRTVVTTVISAAIVRFRPTFISSSRQLQRCHDDVDRLDADEGDDDAADAVDEEVAPEQRVRAQRPTCDAAERQRDQRDDDHGVEDHG